MDWTDIHYRQLARIISKRTWLWTEMVVDRTVLNAEPLDKWLWFPPEQHPIVLQVSTIRFVWFVCSSNNSSSSSSSSGGVCPLVCG
jgi:tRNA-dihydrouridine synthase